MSRPLRIEFAGAVYHVTSRGDRREHIDRDDEDRRAQLRVLAQAMSRFDARAIIEYGDQVANLNPQRQPTSAKVNPPPLKSIDVTPFGN
jgi:hypothetical protein